VACGWVRENLRACARGIQTASKQKHKGRHSTTRRRVGEQNNFLDERAPAAPRGFSIGLTSTRSMDSRHPESEMAYHKRGPEKRVGQYASTYPHRRGYERTTLALEYTHHTHARHPHALMPLTRTHSHALVS
jgi:hypothetical protein